MTDPAPKSSSFASRLRGLFGADRRTQDGSRDRRRAVRSAIGLHLQSGLLSAAQLDFAADGPTLRALAECDVPPDADDAAIAERLATMIEAHPFLGRRTVSLVGVQDLIVQSIRVPMVDGEERDAIVRAEAAERLPVDPATVEIRYLPVAEVRHEDSVRQEVLLLACRRELIARQLRILRLAKLSPAALDLEPAAVMRALATPPSQAAFDDQAAGESRPRQRGIIALSRESLSLTLVESGRILFVKHLAGGGRALDTVIAEAMEFPLAEARRLRLSVAPCRELDAGDDVHRALADALSRPLDAMVRELELCLRYHKVTFRQPLDSLTLVGCDAAGWIARYIGQRLGLDCLPGQLGTPGGPILGQPDAGAALQPMRWIASVGAALHPRRANHDGLVAGDVTLRRPDAASFEEAMP